jgi:hypothetical protein
MVRYVMVLRGATSLLGALEGVGPENLDFFGPFAFGPKKVERGGDWGGLLAAVLCEEVFKGCGVVGMPPPPTIV